MLLARILVLRLQDRLVNGLTELLRADLLHDFLECTRELLGLILRGEDVNRDDLGLDLDQRRVHAGDLNGVVDQMLEEVVEFRTKYWHLPQVNDTPLLVSLS